MKTILNGEEFKNERKPVKKISGKSRESAQKIRVPMPARSRCGISDGLVLDSFLGCLGVLFFLKRL
jgi:hypothetical protein